MNAQFAPPQTITPAAAAKLPLQAKHAPQALPAPTVATAERYVGMVYIPDQFDCADLTELVQREVFGRALPLPPHSARPQGSAGRRRMIGAMRQELATPVAAPEVGAVVLLSQPMPGAVSAEQVLWHMGTLFNHAGRWWLLHNVQDMGGVYLQLLDNMQRMFMHIEGYYVCKPLATAANG